MHANQGPPVSTELWLKKDGRLTLHVATERDLPLFAANDSTFHAIAWGGIQFTFRRDSTGKVDGVDVLELGATRHARRMPA
jgi:hypothetical protein